jgi:hypothetical protein
MSQEDKNLNLNRQSIANHNKKAFIDLSKIFQN